MSLMLHRYEGNVPEDVKTSVQPSFYYLLDLLSFSKISKVLDMLSM